MVDFVENFLSKNPLTQVTAIALKSIIATTVAPVLICANKGPGQVPLMCPILNQESAHHKFALC